MPGQHIITLEQSGATFAAGGELLLDAALAAGISIPFSCRRGECGSCKVKVLSGIHESKPYIAAGTSYPLADDEMLLCQSHACGDMRIEIPGWSLDAQALRFEAEVLKKDMLTQDVTQLVLAPRHAKSLFIRAGQYLKFYLDDGSSRCFSVANIPADDDGKLVFHIRRVAGGRFSEQMLDCLAVGDVLSIEGAFGACTWQPGPHSALLLFASGTGYAGIKPILLAALAEQEAMPVVLYWGGAQIDDFYEREFLDKLSARDVRFSWHGVVSQAGQVAEGFRQGYVQDVAAADSYVWQSARVYACGNPAMVSGVRERCLALGLPAHHFIAEAFVPSGAISVPLAQGSFDPVWECVGPKYSIDGMLAAREQSIRALAQIVGKLRVGMTTGEAVAMANDHLRSMGSSHTWHPTYIRFGDDTVRTPRQGVEKERALRDTDIAVVDLGPVWDGYEGDFGDTIVFGENSLHRACAQAARDVFTAAKEAWQTGLSGRELYDFAEAAAARGGWQLERNLAGHRISDFPHALFGPAKLAEMEIVPSDSVWVLEIQLRHPTELVGAFYEDILIGTPASA
ncbi:NAD(P)H dependent flavin oxidoreductase family protein [Collimonas pratensis]|uniref:Metallopeptidase M24 family protein n=1 Tax=Collimonas pratensis TaxID=279113 RepID=A0A127Q4U6_9BURK|nr:NAD(P)H dependent flavin oxidoreductase family protein [Collimonas pratensis]AMP05057.1 metallopeptidase M24 family protein [Collimonas pratensis]